ncbi:LLM class flavin-dependent oxidoreductase [Priestia megaterium]|uniref:LLM class flavin-dependent oxidoreductase n=1 Tax=Priestia megaterium TaxID=1404 RepID=UPI001CD50419|nr:LLM class flavin-dependent oxidoreductase [Priestia megaterium]
MSNLSNLKLSVLDPSPIIVGGSPKDSLENTLDLAQHAEKWGYRRYWLAEHHNWPGMASSASPLIIGRVASVTNKLRVGSGAMLLSNYSPYSIAEQFGTLESFFPNRIDLGLGRAPGTDGLTARLIRKRFAGEPDFSERLEELSAYLYGSGTVTSDGKHTFHAIPGEGTKVPIWLLGSGVYSAELAGRLGLPFSFAGHFSPVNMEEALSIYRRNFRQSDILDKPYVMLAVNVIAADKEKEAQRLVTSSYQKHLMLTRGKPAQLRPPVDNMDNLWNSYERKAVEEQLFASIIGDASSVKKQLIKLLEKTQADEIMAHTEIFNHQARLRSYEILANVIKD